MRFAVGQAFERFADNRQAVVTQIRDRATLGYFASSITGTSIGFSGRNSIIVSNGSPLERKKPVDVSRNSTFGVAPYLQPKPGTLCLGPQLQGPTVPF